MSAVDRTLDELAHRPVATTLLVLGVAWAIGTVWYFRATGSLTGGLSVESVLLAAIISWTSVTLLLGVMVGYRLGRDA